MKTWQAYKVELDPNNKQRRALVAHCGATRWVYNWALACKIEAFKAKEKIPSRPALSVQLTALKKTDVAPWLNEYHADALTMVLDHVDFAFQKYFTDLKSGKVDKVKAARKKKYPLRKPTEKQIEMLQHLSCFPRFRKKRDRLRASFRRRKITRTHLCFPDYIGKVKLKEYDYLPEHKWSDCKTVTISEKAGRWFASVQVEIEIPDPAPRPINDKTTCGVDFGIKELAVCSDGKVFKNPRPYKKAKEKLCRLQRAASRKHESAKAQNRPLNECENWKKNQKRIAKLHARINNIRRETLHQISHSLTKTKAVVVIEDLNVAGMMKNRHLSGAIADMGFHELRRQLTYKGAWRGCDVRFADRWMPSSKTCSSCGTVRESLKLSERTFRCGCGFTLDRDLNAARNLANLVLKTTGAVSESNACGEGRSDSQQCVSVPVVEAGTQQLILFGQASD